MAGTAAVVAAFPCATLLALASVCSGNALAPVRFGGVASCEGWVSLTGLAGGGLAGLAERFEGEVTSLVFTGLAGSSIDTVSTSSCFFSLCLAGLSLSVGCSFSTIRWLRQGKMVS